MVFYSQVGGLYMAEVFRNFLAKSSDTIVVLSASMLLPTTIASTVLFVIEILARILAMTR